MNSEKSIKRGHNFKKGYSTCVITCLIKRADTRNFTGIHESWVGQYKDFNIYQWKDITGEDHDRMRARVRLEEKARAEGDKHRDWRSIVGLDPFVNKKISRIVRNKTLEEQQGFDARNTLLRAWG